MGKLTILAAMALLAGGTAMATAPGGYYTATPMVAPTKANVVTRTTVWKCANGICAAPRGSDRDTIACELIVARIGALSAFTAGGVPYGEDALAKCNARAC